MGSSAGWNRREGPVEGITELGGPAEELTTDEWRAALGSDVGNAAPAEAFVEAGEPAS